MGVNYIFNKEINAIEVKERGNLSIEYLLGIYKMVENNKDLPRKLNVLIDVRNVKFGFGIKEVKEITAALNNVLPHYKMFSEAVVLNGPMESAIALLISIASKKSNYRMKVFSTREAALGWLSI